MESLNDLPQETLSTIFRYLHPRDWLVCESVCAQWFKIFRGYWKEVKELEFDSANYFRFSLQDGRNFYLGSSDGPWKNDNTVQMVILEHCGEQLEKVILHIPRYLNYVDEQSVLLLGQYCKRLKALSLSGIVSSMTDCLSMVCHDLPNLEEVFIWDETYPEDIKDTDSTASLLVGDMISICNGLRFLNVNFIFLPPPSLESCRRLAALERIESLRWLFFSPLPPEYVEEFLASIVGCARSLRELRFYSKLKAPLDGDGCAQHLRQLAETGNLEMVNFGFQLHKPLPDDGSGHIAYEPTDSAPWTPEILWALTAFSGIRELTLSHFDLADEDGVLALKAVCKGLRILRLVDNYGLCGKSLWVIRGNLEQIRSIDIAQARLSHADLVELIVRCPNLETISLSMVEGMSFKKLVLETRAAIHRCGCHVEERGDGETRPLNLRLETARGFVHVEAEQLISMTLCGMKLLPPSYANVFIDRVCQNQEE